jgi:hypothetical protein
LPWPLATGSAADCCLPARLNSTVLAILAPLLRERGLFCVQSTATMKVGMSKKFKGKLCAYCTEAMATAGDHIFSREFFLVEDRDDLPQAPACDSCNNEKSKLEHYLTAVLPFTGRHQQAVANLEAGVPRRLAKNPRLHRKLVDSVRPAWLRQGTGLYQATMTSDFDGDKLIGLLQYVGRGLAWHHWDLYLRPNDDVSAMLMPDMGSSYFQSVIDGWRHARRVEGDLGNGTVQYVGVQAPDPAELTVWKISMYGGLVLSDSRVKSDGPVESCSVWWVITGPPELHETVARLK